MNSPIIPTIGHLSNQIPNNLFANIRLVTSSAQTNHIVNSTLSLNQDNKGNQITPVSYDQYLAMVNRINSTTPNHGYIFPAPIAGQQMTFLTQNNMITSQAHQSVINTMSQQQQQNITKPLSNSSILDRGIIVESPISSSSGSIQPMVPTTINNIKGNEKKSIKQKIVDLTQNSKQKGTRGNGNIPVKGRNVRVTKSRSPKTYKSQSTRQNRIAHNEMEKNRRANLRGHLEMLRTVVPSATISSRDTTLALLTRANNHLKTIKETKIKMMEQKEALLSRNRQLKEKIAHLKNEIKNRKVKTVSYISNISSLSTTTTTLSIAGSSSSNFLPIISYHSLIFEPKKTTKSPIKQYPEISQNNIIVNKQYSYDPFNDGLIAALPFTYPYKNGTMSVS